MLLKGRVTIVATDAVTGQVTWTKKQNNLIPDNTLVEILSWNSSAAFFNQKVIAISTQDVVPIPTSHTLTGVLANGYIPENVTSPTWNESVDPPFGQIQNRLNFTGTARTFRTVGLVDDGTVADGEQKTYAYVRMDTECTQGANEFLDIFYRIQFDNFGGQGLIEKARYDFGRCLFGRDLLGGAVGFRMSFLYASPCTHNASYNNLFPGGSNIASVTPGIGGVVGWTSGQAVADHFKWKYLLEETRDESVGIIFNKMLQGVTTSFGANQSGSSDTDKSSAYSASPFGYKEEPYQTGFWHGTGAPGPFYDAGFTGTSKGTIILSGTWTGGWPELYRLNITVNGAVGTSRYRFSVRKHLGFEGNTYIDRKDVGCPFRNPNIAAAAGQHGWRDEDNDVLRYSNTKVVQYDRTGVTLLDLLSGAHSTWDATANPALLATDIRQCATDGSKIYAACRVSGLWIIDPAAGTITNPLTAPCYGADVGIAGKVWAIADGGLFNSTDWGTGLPFVYPSVTDGNWARIRFLRADPQTAGDRLGIVVSAATGETANKILWWDSGSNTVVEGYSGTEVRLWPASFDVSDTGGFWAIALSSLEFGSALATGLSSAPALKELNHSVYGLGNYYKIAFHNQHLITSSALVDKADLIINNYSANPLQPSSFFTHMEGGIVVGCRIMRQLFSDNSYCWQNYGWNGSAWVLNNTTGRLTHTTDQLLINGVRARFANATSAPHFISGNFFTQGVCKGLWKDNATELSWTSAWYSVPAQFDSVASGTIPAELFLQLPAALDPDFIRLETDSPELHSFQINGVPVAMVYVAGEAPGPGEVSIDADAYVVFNATDAGKAFTASAYTWLKR